MLDAVETIIAKLKIAIRIKSGLKLENKTLWPKNIEMVNTAIDTAPKAKSLVTLTGSVFVLDNKKTVTKKAPRDKYVANFFSTSNFNMDTS